MIDKSELIRAIEEIAPPRLAAEWDNSGLQLDPAVREVGRILVALELTPDVISEAKAGGFDFVVTHHPMFFGAPQGKGASARNLLQSDAAGRFALRLLTEPPVPVGVYAAHTSFDAAEGGLNDELQQMLGLSPWGGRLHPDACVAFSDIAPFSRMGRFAEPETLAGAFARVRSVLGTGADIRVCGDSAQSVLKIMTVCGGGGTAIPFAVRTGCSLLVTGDVRQHEWRLAEAEGLALIDAGHYYTERMFATLFVKRLTEALGPACAQVRIEVSKEIRRPYASPAQAGV